ncbi:hypothetical protein SFHH103_01678 [Sinorhizobium fredii HH103]|uniref:Uncharacterized protein n=1 Tax=Sinorhizobium fredii (strain HH103) TaxID=1117943 RepID=G9A7E5_SINF1|nr:hypothetical protein [Sinorhizobium fredii]CCE96175.1 hypothetical protein SFHH103_01678 [Sinorhizobium fredii HH103]
MTEEPQFTLEQRVQFLQRDIEETRETIEILLSLLIAQGAFSSAQFWDWRRKAERIQYALREPALAHASIHAIEEAEALLEHLAPDVPTESR